MEDTPEFKWAVKVVLRRQLRDLVNQLQDAGDEIAIMTVNTTEDMYTHFGTSAGEWFISEQRNLTSDFLNFCKTQQKSGKIQLSSKFKTAAVSGGQVYQQPAKKTVQSGSTATVSTPTTPATPVTPLKEVTEVLEVHIPIQMKRGISDIAIQSLVGRLVATIIDKDKDSSMPFFSRSGRKIKPRVIDEPGSTKQMTPEGQKILESLANINTQVLKRVQVKVGGGLFANVASTPIPTSEEMYSLAVAVMDELLLLEKHMILTKKQIKVMLAFGMGNDIKVWVATTNDETQAKEEYDNDVYLDGDMKVEADVSDAGFNDEDNNDEMEAESYQTGPDFQTLLDASVADQSESPTYTGNFQKKDRNTNKLSYTEKCELFKERRQKKAEKRVKSMKRTMKLPCDHCGALITGAHHLKEHIQNVHLRIKNAVCKVCTKGFWGQSKLDDHMFDVHTRQCTKCNEYVVEKEPWKEGTHNRMVRMAPCKCGELVPVSSLPGRKIPGEGDPCTGAIKRSTVKGSKFSCDICGKLFNTRTSCSKHTKTHFEQKDFVCDFCGKSFAYHNSLKKHLQNDHNALQHVCEVCERVYTSEQSLQIHVTKVHRSIDLGDDYDIDKDVASMVPDIRNIQPSGDQTDMPGASGSYHNEDFDVSSFVEKIVNS